MDAEVWFGVGTAVAVAATEERVGVGDGFLDDPVGVRVGVGDLPGVEVFPGVDVGVFPGVGDFAVPAGRMSKAALSGMEINPFVTETWTDTRTFTRLAAG